jgi:hypothetical protein
VSNCVQTSRRKERCNWDVPRFCVSYALDWSSSVQVIQIESPNAAEVYQLMEQRFLAAYDSMTISAIVEYRQPAAQRAVAGSSA